jgi:hypothetical protein
MTEEIKLDRKRSFGTVYNDPNIGFAQDNRHFRHDGTLYVPPETPKPTEVKVETPAEAPKRETLTRSGMQR